MKKITLAILSLVFLSSTLFAQEISKEKVRQKGHYNSSKFKQLDEELPTPNKQHTASGAPGYEYTQQQVDYKMNIILWGARGRLDSSPPTPAWTTTIKWGIGGTS